jgi:hypothetical protein
MIFQLSIMEKTITFPNEMIHITLECVVHPMTIIITSALHEVLYTCEL